MFSLAYNLTKNDVEILPVEISSRKNRANNVDFSIIKIISKKVSENNVDFLTREITSKNVRGSNADFSIIKIISKKIRSNDMDFSISKITSKKYVEMIWKFVEVWSSTFRRNIHVESMSIWLGVPVGVVLCIIWSKCKNEDKKFFEKKN